MRRSLCFLGRILKTRHKSLCAVLAATVSGKHMPWTSLIVSDLAFLWNSVPAVKCRLPNPMADPSRWMLFIVDDSDMWSTFVSKLFFVHSCLDKSVKPNVADSNAFCGLTCAHRPAFVDAKALAQHNRVKHGSKAPISAFVDGSGVVCYQLSDPPQMFETPNRR